MLCCVVLCYVVLCCVVLCCVACCVVLCCVVLCCGVGGWDCVEVCGGVWGGVGVCGGGYVGMVGGGGYVGVGWGWCKLNSLIGYCHNFLKVVPRVTVKNIFCDIKSFHHLSFLKVKF